MGRGQDTDTETQRHRDTETQRHRDTETQRHRERARQGVRVSQHEVVKEKVALFIFGATCYLVASNRKALREMMVLNRGGTEKG